METDRGLSYTSLPFRSPGERKQLNVLYVDKVALPSCVIGIMHCRSRYETVCIYFTVDWVEIPACCSDLDCYIWRCWFQ